MNNFSVIILQPTEKKGTFRWRQTFDEFSSLSFEIITSKGKISFGVSMLHFSFTSVCLVMKFTYMEAVTSYLLTYLTEFTYM
jgi:hypothetical protein